MKSFRSQFLGKAVIAQEKQLAADKAAGLCPEDFAPGKNPLPNVAWEAIVGKDGQKKKVGQCPVCVTEGHDKYGTHLVIYPSGKFGCIRFEATKIEGPERTEHLRKVWKMAGGKSSGLKLPAPMPAPIKEKRLAMMATVKKEWAEARAKYAMTMEDWQAMSADLPGSPEADFRFACSLWKPGQLAWFGERFECSAVFPTHLFETAKEASKAWEHVNYRGLDHTFGFAFKPGSDGRGKNNRAGQVYDVVEHDDEGIEGQIALTRYLQSMGCKLLLAVSTGNRGFHSCFDSTSITPERRELIAFLLECIGADKSAFQRASTRTPGAIRQNQNDGKPYGNRQPIVYISKI